MAATACQIAFTERFHESEFTKSIWPWVVTTQVMQCLTIITSCVPFLRPLIESLPSGMFMSDELRRRGATVRDREGYVKASEGNYVLRKVERPP